MKNPSARKQAPATEPPAAPNKLGKCTGLDGAPIKFAQSDPDRLGLQDSGWWFFAGDEDDVYKNEISSLGVYAINIDSNYD